MDTEKAIEGINIDLDKIVDPVARAIVFQFISPVLTYQDLEDFDKSQHVKLSGSFNLAPKSGTADKKVHSDKPEQHPAEGSSKDSDKFQPAKSGGGFNPLGIMDVGHKRSDKHELHRTTVLDNIDIKTQSEVSTLNRDLSKAREITKKSKTHVRVFAPIASLATLKGMPQEMGQQFARIPAYFKPNTVEHYQAQALSKELEAYQKQGLSTEVIQEKLRDQKTLSEIAQRGNRAFVEQYFIRTGSAIPEAAQESLDKGLTPHFEKGQEGEKVLRFAEPQHISLEADKRGKLNLVVQSGERPQIKPVLAQQLSQGATVKPKPDKTKQPKTKPSSKERPGSSRSGRSSQLSRSNNPFRLGADIDEVALYYSGLVDEGQTFDEGFGLSTVERKYSSETDEMMALAFEDTPVPFSLAGPRSSKQDRPSVLEKTLDFFIEPVHAEPSFREEMAAERRKDLLFGYAVQHSHSGPREGSTFGKSSKLNYLGEASSSKDPLVTNQRQKLEKLSGLVGKKDQSFVHTSGQHNERGECSQIESTPRDKVSSSVPTSTAGAANNTGNKTRVGWSSHGLSSSLGGPREGSRLGKGFSLSPNSSLSSSSSSSLSLSPNDQHTFNPRSSSSRSSGEEMSSGTRGLGGGTFLTVYDKLRDQAIRGFPTEPLNRSSATQHSASSRQDSDDRRDSRLRQKAKSAHSREFAQSSLSSLGSGNSRKRLASEGTFLGPYPGSLFYSDGGPVSADLERFAEEHQQASPKSKEEGQVRETFWERQQRLKDEISVIRHQIEMNQSAGFVDTIIFGLTKPLSKKMIDESLPGYGQGQFVAFTLETIYGGVVVKEVDDKVWLVSFMDYDLGYFDEQTCKLEPLDNPFGPRVLPMSSV